MTKPKTILLALSVIGLLVIACIVSYFCGFRDGVSAGRIATIGMDAAQFTIASQCVSAQMANGDCEGVKYALNEYLALLEKYKDVKDSLIISPKSYLVDKAFAHT